MASPFKVYWSQVHPVFMIAAIGATVAGALYSPTPNIANLIIFCFAVFFALYFAHVKDSYVDYYERHEDASASLTKKQSHDAMRFCMIAVVVCAAYFALQGLWIVLGILLIGFLLAFFHTPLDLGPIGATIGYPTGLAVAALGGYYVQAGNIPEKMILYAFAVWLILNGVKIVDDVKDYAWDKKFGKISAPVFFGIRRAKEVAVILVILGASFGIALSLLHILPSFAILSYIPLYVAALMSLTHNDRKRFYGLDILLVGVYTFTAIQLIGLGLRLA